ncbi:hypothetical protein BGW80DRAFT_590473 [Lactifluus volemus]|nr:hypothetical protein BGW80DRAFT_590473 [Lactifluus volemus]
MSKKTRGRQTLEFFLFLFSGWASLSSQPSMFPSSSLSPSSSYPAASFSSLVALSESSLLRTSSIGSASVNDAGDIVDMSS